MPDINFGINILYNAESLPLAAFLHTIVFRSDHIIFGYNVVTTVSVYKFCNMIK